MGGYSIYQFVLSSNSERNFHIGQSHILPRGQASFVGVGVLVAEKAEWFVEPKIKNKKFHE